MSLTSRLTLMMLVLVGIPHASTAAENRLETSTRRAVAFMQCFTNRDSRSPFSDSGLPEPPDKWTKLTAGPMVFTDNINKEDQIEFIFKGTANPHWLGELAYKALLSHSKSDNYNRYRALEFGNATNFHLTFYVRAGEILSTSKVDNFVISFDTGSFSNLFQHTVMETDKSSCWRFLDS